MWWLEFNAPPDAAYRSFWRRYFYFCLWTVKWRAVVGFHTESEGQWRQIHTEAYIIHHGWSPHASDSGTGHRGRCNDQKDHCGARRSVDAVQHGWWFQAPGIIGATRHRRSSRPYTRCRYCGSLRTSYNLPVGQLWPSCHKSSGVWPAIIWTDRTRTAGAARPGAAILHSHRLVTARKFIAPQVKSIFECNYGVDWIAFHFTDAPTDITLHYPE